MAIRIYWRDHTAKDGTTTLYARYKEPYRKDDGTVGLRPRERSVGVVSRREGAKKVEKWYEEALAKSQVEPTKVPLFADVVTTYQKTQGGSPYFIPILKAIGHRPVTDVDQALVMELASSIYPGRTAATINRQIFTPIIAALRLSAGKTYAMPMLKRPKGYDSLPDLDVPDADWFRAVIPVANPWLRAFLIIGRLHGRRPGELVNRDRTHFNRDAGTLVVKDAKGNQTILIDLAEPAYAALCAIPELDSAKKIKVGKDGKGTPRLTKPKRAALFGTFHLTTMRKWLVKACAEAGVPYHMAKEAGRHAFATGALEEGKSLVWLKDAGYWKTIKVPAEKYGHLEKQKVHRQARESGETWFAASVGELDTGHQLQIEGRAEPSPSPPHASTICSTDVHAQTSANEGRDKSPVGMEKDEEIQ